ncbi:MAG: hypothetical protein H7A36_01215 [Chlamydiales bacterium]|nr:hypothetical protein [Chlamydiales bacterium]
MNRIEWIEMTDFGRNLENYPEMEVPKEGGKKIDKKVLAIVVGVIAAAILAYGLSSIRMEHPHHVPHNAIHLSNFRQAYMDPSDKLFYDAKLRHAFEAFHGKVYSYIVDDTPYRHHFEFISGDATAEQLHQLLQRHDVGFLNLDIRIGNTDQYLCWHDVWVSP